MHIIKCTLLSSTHVLVFHWNPDINSRFHFFVSNFVKIANSLLISIFLKYKYLICQAKDTTVLKKEFHKSVFYQQNVL